MKLRILTAALAVAVLAIAAFLTVEHWRGATLPCPVAGGGCDAVARSGYAELLGIRVSVLGLAGSAALLGACLVGGFRGAAARLGIAGLGAAFSLYLTYLEGARIDAYCAWCVTSAILWGVLLAVTLADAWREQPQLGNVAASQV